MKTLLVAGYWYPYNNAGAFRWLNFGKHIEFDVLTTKTPIKSTVDHSIEKTNSKVFRFGNKLPAVVWGVFASVAVQFKKYDVYIFTSPPESLLIGAYILQLRGKKVLVDMRDSIDRERQKNKYLIPVYKYLYYKIKHVVVCWQTIDTSKPCVYHGTEVMERDADALKCPLYYTGRTNHESYIRMLRKGIIPTFKNKTSGYYASSAHPVIAMGYKLDNDSLHEEMYRLNPISIEESASQMNKIINEL